MAKVEINECRFCLRELAREQFQDEHDFNMAFCSDCRKSYEQGKDIVNVDGEVADTKEIEDCTDCGRPVVGDNHCWVWTEPATYYDPSWSEYVCQDCYGKRAAKRRQQERGRWDYEDMDDGR